MKFSFLVTGLLATLSNAAAQEECDNVFNQVGAGICEAYFAINCDTWYDEDCVLLKDAFFAETSTVATWTEPTLPSGRRATSTTSHPHTVLLRGSDGGRQLTFDCCSNLTGKATGMCQAYHSIQGGGCMDNPSFTPCQKIMSKYVATTGTTLTCESTPKVNNPDTPSPTVKLSTPAPSKNPTAAPVTDVPSAAPTPAPVTDVPSAEPTPAPVTDVPSAEPTPAPVTDVPSAVPTGAPVTGVPSAVPTVAPVTDAPTASPPTRTLEEEIIQDMMPPTSSSCTRTTAGTSFNFESSQPTSNWYGEYASLEETLFLAKMEHVDNNANRSWTMRFGQAGNIYSLVGPMGETVPPQKHDNAPWVDEVWQQVQPLGSAGNNDGDDSTNIYFIHEAGTYTKDRPDSKCLNGTLYSLPQDIIITRDSGACTFQTDNGGRFRCGASSTADVGASPNAAEADAPLVLLEGNGSQKSIVAKVRHWSYNGGAMFIYDEGLTLAEVNEALTPNNVVNVYYYEPPAETVYTCSAADLYDYTSTPFYSPTLGSYCNNEDGECGFLSWGQQAHLPTPWKSPMLYLNRYVNCGDGVIEYTSLRHNNVGSPDTFTYTNVPWGGTRRSVLKDVVFTNGPQGDEHTLQYPLEGWGNNNHIIPIRDTLGYAVFAEDLPKGTNCGDPYPVPAGVILSTTFNCADAHVHSSGRQLYRCELDGNSVGDNAGTGGSKVQLKGTSTSIVAEVLHWSNPATTTRRFLYIYKDDLSSTEIYNAINGGIVSVTYPCEGKREEDNLALAHVFGQNAIGSGSYPRVRAGFSARDYNVYTINTTPNIQPGMSYHYRQYFMMDSYQEMASRGPTWASQAGDGIYPAGGPGRDITLYYDNTALGSAFGYTIDGDTSCIGSAAVACVGKTTPQIGFKALFTIQCGTDFVVTDDPYYFTPPQDPASDGDDIPGGAGYKLRPYQCAGASLGERPIWKLLGFFDVNDCLEISSGYQFSEDFC